MHNIFISTFYLKVRIKSQAFSCSHYKVAFLNPHRLIEDKQLITIFTIEPGTKSRIDECGAQLRSPVARSGFRVSDH